MTKEVNPLWVDIKHIDESWHSNPGNKYGKFFRLIAERIPCELKQGLHSEDRIKRLHTADDVVAWLLEQAIKGENDVRYNYDWQLTDTH
jgi:hypothetical protein